MNYNKFPQETYGIILGGCKYRLMNVNSTIMTILTMFLLVVSYVPFEFLSILTFLLLTLKLKCMYYERVYLHARWTCFLLFINATSIQSRQEFLFRRMIRKIKNSLSTGNKSKEIVVISSLK